MHQIITIIAKDFIILSVLLAAYVWLRLNRTNKVTFVLEAIAGAIIAGALAVVGSKLYHDPRPFVVGHFTPYFSHGADNGFPSDHTLLSSLLAFLVLKYHRTAGWVLLVLAILIGLSRVVAGVHHLVDIIGSIIFAAIGVYVAQWLVKRFYKQAAKA